MTSTFPRIAAALATALAMAGPPAPAFAQGYPRSPARPSGPTILPFPFPLPPPQPQPRPPTSPAPRARVPGSDRYSAAWGIAYQFVPYGGAYGARLTRNPTPGSPAATLQFEPGDMIVRLDNRPLYRPEDLDNHVARTDVVFVNIRTGRPQSGVVYLPGRNPGPFPPGPYPPDPYPGTYRLGVFTTPAFLDPPRPGLPRRAGLRIASVEPGGAAERAGLRPGDVIIHANRRPVVSHEGFRRILDESGGTLDMIVARGGRYGSNDRVFADLRTLDTGPVYQSVPESSRAADGSPTPPPPPTTGSPLAAPTAPGGPL